MGILSVTCATSTISPQSYVLGKCSGTCVICFSEMTYPQLLKDASLYIPSLLSFQRQLVSGDHRLGVGCIPCMKVLHLISAVVLKPAESNFLRQLISQDFLKENQPISNCIYKQIQSSAQSKYSGTRQKSVHQVHHRTVAVASRKC